MTAAPSFLSLRVLRAFVVRFLDRRSPPMGRNAAGAFARVAGPLAASLVFAGLTVEGPFIMGAAIVVPAIFLALSAGRAARRAA
jgi:hypothetical protein